MFLYKLHKYCCFNSTFTTAPYNRWKLYCCRYIKKLENDFVLSRNRKQIVFKRFSLFIFLRSTIVVVILSECFQCSNFQAHRKSLYYYSFFYIVFTHSYRTAPTLKWICFYVETPNCRLFRNIFWKHFFLHSSFWFRFVCLAANRRELNSYCNLYCLPFSICSTFYYYHTYYLVVCIW